MKDWKKICISEGRAIVDAMKVITETGSKFAIVLSETGILKGTLTDGDIRRALLNNFKMTDDVGSAMNLNPLVANSNTSNAELFSLMETNNITHVPIVDDHGRLLKVLSLKDVKVIEPQKDNAVVLMVGGLGSRLGELTIHCPKSMLKLGDKPILEVIIENFKEHGFHNFFLSVNYKSEVIESYFQDGSSFDVNIKYIREKERMGTAGSLSLLEPINNLPIVIMNGDILAKVNFSSLLEDHVSNKYDACICTSRHDYQIPFGVIQQDEDGCVVKIEEKPHMSCMVNAGIYTMNPKMLSYLEKDKYYDMPVLLEDIIAKNYKVGTFQVQDYWLDIGRRDDFHKAEMDHKNKF